MEFFFIIPIITIVVPKVLWKNVFLLLDLLTFRLLDYLGHRDSKIVHISCFFSVYSVVYLVVSFFLLLDLLTFRLLDYYEEVINNEEIIQFQGHSGLIYALIRY